MSPQSQAVIFASAGSSISVETFALTCSVQYPIRQMDQQSENTEASCLDRKLLTSHVAHMYPSARDMLYTEYV
jgi:hypothetical protein